MISEELVGKKPVNKLAFGALDQEPLKICNEGFFQTLKPVKISKSHSSFCKRENVVTMTF